MPLKIHSIIKDKQKIEDAKILLDLFLNKHTSKIIDLLFGASKNWGYSIAEIKDLAFEDSPTASRMVIEKLCEELVNVKIITTFKHKSERGTTFYSLNKDRLDVIVQGLIWLSAKKNFSKLAQQIKEQ